jgi:hypothetical protein
VTCIREVGAEEPALLGSQELFVDIRGEWEAHLVDRPLVWDKAGTEAGA